MKRPIDWKFWGVKPWNGPTMRVRTVNGPCAGRALTPNWKP
jgi:hypothetical protein